jgi:hypothetical protein
VDLEQGRVDSVQKLDLRRSESSHVAEIFGEDLGRIQENLSRSVCVDSGDVADDI